MLTKKYYQVFAKILGESKTVEEATNKLIDFFAEDNPFFDVVRFRKAVEEAKAKKLKEVI